MKKLPVFLSVITSLFAGSVTAQSWNLNGNAGTNANSNFLGTTDSVALVLKTNNKRSGLIDVAAATANTAFGYQGLLVNTGNFNTAMGYTALAGNTNGGHNTGIGALAMRQNTTGVINTAIGSNALLSNTTGNGNSAIGAFTMTSNTTGEFNTATGYAALLNNTTGLDNTATGNKALLYNTTGNNNTAMGDQALRFNSTGNENTAVGMNAMRNNENGLSNVATGNEALFNNTSGNFNSAHGYKALHENTIGFNNVATGTIALFSNTTGQRNTGIGHSALNTNTTGHNNTALGNEALRSNTTGSNNTAVGYQAFLFGNHSNSTAIGANASAGASNQVRIGNSSVISIGGFASFTNVSDGRVKRAIQENVPGLAFINQLRPVTYHLDLEAADRIRGFAERKDAQGRAIPFTADEITGRAAKERELQSGFIAQDVEQAAKKLGYEFSGVDAAKNDQDLYGLRYAEFVVPLVKAVQELSAQNEQLRKELEALKTAVHKISPASSGATGTAVHALSQNSPNPFAQATAVRYSIPAGAKTAQLVITDAAGKTVMQQYLAGGTMGTVNVNGASLGSGMYQYSLVVDGKVMDTKQMTVAR